MNPNALDLRLFLLVMCRVSSLFIFVAFFNGQMVPTKIKVVFSLLLSFLIYSFLHTRAVVSLPSADDLFSYSAFIVRESLVGLALGAGLAAVFAGVSAAGSLVSNQIGFSMASVFDPDMGGQVDVISELKNIFALMVFVLLDGPHQVLEGILKSYFIIPIGSAIFTDTFQSMFISQVGGIFIIALKIGAPVLIALWVVNLCLAMLARLLPQLNIFVLDFPVKCAVGLLALMIAMPYVSAMLESVFHSVLRNSDIALKSLQG